MSPLSRIGLIGDVHAEDVAHVLRHVELSGDVLTEVQTAMAGQGIQIDDEVDHIADDTPSGGGRRVVVTKDRSAAAPAPDHDEQLLSRGRGRRTLDDPRKRCLAGLLAGRRDQRRAAAGHAQARR